MSSGSRGRGTAPLTRTGRALHCHKLYSTGGGMVGGRLGWGEGEWGRVFWFVFDPLAKHCIEAVHTVSCSLGHPCGPYYQYHTVSSLTHLTRTPLAPFFSPRFPPQEAALPDPRAAVDV